MREITDAEAIQALQEEEGRGLYQATECVTKSVWHSVASLDSNGNEKLRNQAFLTQGSYCSPLELEQAKKFEKQFPELNKIKRKQFDDPDFREIKDPLKTKYLEVTR